MGILKRNVSAKSGRSAVTIIAQGNRFQGETSIVGKLHVDGEFEGSLDSSDDITVGRQGRVSGRIRAKAVNVSGTLEGMLVCESLHIERGGRVCANVHCTKLSIDPDGVFVGERQLLDPQWLPQDTAVTRLDTEDDDGACVEVIDLDSALIDSLPDRITLSRK